MRKKQNKLIMLLFFAFAIVMGTFASSSNVQAVSGEYLLKPGGETNDNVNIDSGSYVVTGTPGQKVDLKLLVLNKSNDARKFMYVVNTAYTNDSGQLAYNKSKVTDSALKLQTKDTATPQKSTFKVPGNTTATLSFSITVPKKAFKGTLMGAVSVYPYKEKAPIKVPLAPTVPLAFSL